MSFEEFLQKKNEEAKSKPTFNPNERIDRYKESVDTFYGMLKNEWLPGFYDNLNPTLTPITIHEESLGDYSVDSLSLTIGSSVIKFNPVGTILIGTPGRIDMICGIKKAMFIMTGKKSRTPRAHAINTTDREGFKNRDFGPLVWKLVDERGMMSFVDLNAETIQGLIMNMVG